MAQKPIQDAVDGALKAVDRILMGEKVPIAFAEDLAYVERFLGLKRPLASYAPRTRRRYVAAARKGDVGAKKSLSQERVRRQETTRAKWGLTSGQLTKLNKYRIPIMKSGIDINEYLDPDVIKDIVQMYGFDYMLTVLKNQYDSILKYTEGNSEPGRQRWLSRGELEAEAEENMKSSFAAAVYHVKGTDPYYYYHGHIR